MDERGSENDPGCPSLDDDPSHQISHIRFEWITFVPSFETCFKTFGMCQGHSVTSTGQEREREKEREKERKRKRERGREREDEQVEYMFGESEKCSFIIPSSIHPSFFFLSLLSFSLLSSLSLPHFKKMWVEGHRS